LRKRLFGVCDEITLKKKVPIILFDDRDLSLIHIFHRKNRSRARIANSNSLFARAPTPAYPAYRGVEIAHTRALLPGCTTAGSLPDRVPKGPFATSYLAYRDAARRWLLEE
jgi:hypothetical protein